MLTDDAEAYGYTGCEPFGPNDDYDPMYAGPDDYSWRQFIFDAMPYGFGILSWEPRSPKQKFVPRIAQWAERYWSKLVDECPYGDDHEAEKRIALFNRWCAWAKKITTSNRKADRPRKDRAHGQARRQAKARRGSAPARQPPRPPER